MLVAYFFTETCFISMFQNFICRPLWKAVQNLLDVLQRMMARFVNTNRAIILQDDRCWGKQKDKVLVGYKSSWMRMSLLGCRLAL